MSYDNWKLRSDRDDSPSEEDIEDRDDGEPTQNTMDIKINDDGTVTITVNRYELAMLSYSLGSFQTLAACPRPEYPGDRATDEDRDLANTMEQALFAAWAKLDEKVSYSEE